jgi:hypothetical protein
VFSTSKDHRQGDKAMAGCILVDNDKIQVRFESFQACLQLSSIFCVSAGDQSLSQV